MKIISMNETHIQAVAELEKQCFSLPWNEAMLRPELSNPLSLWLVAVDEDRVIGYIGSQSVCAEADMMNIAVSATYRRRNVAQSLVRALLDGLSQRQVHSLSLEVRASNAPAVALYEKLGFSQVGRRPGYYRRPKEDALIYRKEW